MRTLQFIADDLGASAAVNDAIFAAHAQGALNGAALMLGQPGTAEAIARARATPSLAIGWHVHLLDSQPCSLPTWPWRTSPTRAGLAMGLSARAQRLIRKEIRTQWQLMQDTGLPCTFVNGHHHLHMHPFVRKVLIETLPADFKGWIRWGVPRFFTRNRAAPFYRTLHACLQRAGAWPYRTSTTLWGIDRTGCMCANEITKVIETLGTGVHEYMFHPRNATDDADLACLIKLREAGF